MAMTVEHFQAILEAFLSREPFRPFTVNVKSGTRIEIDRPNAVAFRNGFAVYVAPGRVPFYFDNDSVVDFIGAPVSDTPAIVKRG
jgi:hypothetical protein